MFVEEQCAPCDTGYTCAGGQDDAQPCPAGQFSNIIGSTTCSACPDGTAAAGGECRAGVWPACMQTSDAYV